MSLSVRRSLVLSLVCLGSFCVLQLTPGEVSAQRAKRTGKLAGVVIDKGNSKTMNNAWVEIKVDGEEGTGRRFWPAADPKLGGPQREILAAIRAVAIGARVEAEWIDAGDGKDLTKFQVLKAPK